jgi:uncharacterized protein YcaQ
VPAFVGVKAHHSRCKMDAQSLQRSQKVAAAFRDQKKKKARVTLAVAASRSCLIHRRRTPVFFESENPVLERDCDLNPQVHQGHMSW